MNKAIIFENVCNSDEITKKDYRTFFRNVKLLKEFGDYCNLNCFIYLFGEDEGKRLWHCYVVDTKRDIYNFFFTYLSNSQVTVLVANILDNEDLKASCKIFMID